MKRLKIPDRIIYAVVAILSLAALWLVLNVPVNFLNTRVVYQGF
jgi:hypothetical protein